MLQNYFIVRCLRCGQKNRIVRTRLKDKPVCGSCHAPLDELIVQCLHCGVKNRITEYRPHNLPLCARCGQPLYHEGEDMEA
jgi:thioredoxin 2